MSDEIRAYYDLIAQEYGQTFFHELDRKPFDRSILSRFSELTKNQGLVCDIGCGPGHIAYFLYKQGVRVLGIDLSSAMIEEARQLCPDMEFRQGDMLNLDFLDNSLAGVTAFYAIVHFSLPDLELALREFYRVVKPGGYILFSFHIGHEIIRMEKTHHNRTVDFVFFDPDEVINQVEARGWIIEEVIIRYPYRDIEYPSKRAYILARKDQAAAGP